MAGPACCSLSWWASGARCGQSSQISHLVLHQGGDLLQAAGQLHLLAHRVLLQGTDDLSGQKRVPCLSPSPPPTGPGLCGPAFISAVADSSPGPPWGIWTDTKFLPNLGPSSPLPAGLGLNTPLPAGGAPSPWRALTLPGRNTCGCGCRVHAGLPDSEEQRCSSAGSTWASEAPA